VEVRFDFFEENSLENDFELNLIYFEVKGNTNCFEIGALSSYDTR
jgi:hypothetical protein